MLCSTCYNELLYEKQIIKIFFNRLQFHVLMSNINILIITSYFHNHEINNQK